MGSWTATALKHLKAVVFSILTVILGCVGILYLSYGFDYVVKHTSAADIKEIVDSLGELGEALSE